MKEPFPDLMPCPFCGAIPELTTRDVEPQNDPWYGCKAETFILCDCGACLFDNQFHEGFGEHEAGKIEAINRWNRRTRPEDLK